MATRAVIAIGSGSATVTVSMTVTARLTEIVNETETEITTTLGTLNHAMTAVTIRLRRRIQARPTRISI